MSAFHSLSVASNRSVKIGELWREYESVLTTATAQSRFDAARRLTSHGFVASAPRFLPTCAECPAQIVYAVRTPHEFPALARLTLDGSAPDRLTTRYLGASAGVGRDTIVFDQQELRRNAGPNLGLPSNTLGEAYMRVFPQVTDRLS